MPFSESPLYIFLRARVGAIGIPGMALSPCLLPRDEADTRDSSSPRDSSSSLGQQEPLSCSEAPAWVDLTRHL